MRNDKFDDDDFFEYMLKKSLDEYAQKQGEILLEQLQSAPEIKYSHRFKSKIKWLLRSVQPYKTMRTVGNRIVAVFLVLFFVSGTVVYTDAFKLNFFTGILSQKDDHNNLSIGKTAIEFSITQKDIPEGWDYIYLPGYIPSGFLLKEIKKSKHTFIITLENGENEELVFSQSSPLESLTGKDNENSDYDIFEHNYKQFYLLDSPTNKILSWNNDVYSFQLRGNLEKEELLKVVDNLNVVDF